MNTENITPIGEYVLIGVVESEKTTSSGLFLNTAIEENRARVKAVGDKVNTDEGCTKISVGDVIIFIPGNGIKVTNSEDSDMLISVKNIIGIIKGE